MSRKCCFGDELRADYKEKIAAFESAFRNIGPDQPVFNKAHVVFHHLADFVEEMVPWDSLMSKLLNQFILLLPIIFVILVGLKILGRNCNPSADLRSSILFTSMIIVLFSLRISMLSTVKPTNRFMKISTIHIK